MTGILNLDKLTKEAVQFSIICLPDESNYFSDPTLDKPTIKEISEGLQDNPWLWCTVQVVATWKNYSGSDYLGGCSYLSEEDFCHRSGILLEEMKNAALQELKNSIYRGLSDLTELIEY